MEKVIAVMNKPKNCEECMFGVCKYSLPLSTHRKAYYCQLKESKGRVTEDFDYDEEVHLSDCPLKPIPEEDNSWTDDEYADGWAMGHNACLKKILDS